MVNAVGSRAQLAKLFGGLEDKEVELFVFDLDFWARREQVPPDKFSTCFVMAGRSFGKTWRGARWVIKKVWQAKSAGALIGPTAADVRDTMIRGPSGLLALSPLGFTLRYEPFKRRVTWPNGVAVTTASMPSAGVSTTWFSLNSSSQGEATQWECSTRCAPC
ncbi:terminase family protein [Stigmatella sp. ncwal1]|uniref:Terminase family protein n=1 Tax=Stigmatella ashevillensis TaxID=2995309 RepID=A0ABT5DGJ4_9BACT|nr:terminase family protein [Stigmatella ashevillena]MDC0712733.1 terminase family protein [Stigmatella ashevillena]